MNENIINLPCSIGDAVYIVENYNKYYDKCKYYNTIYDSKVVIKSYFVESFIIDDEGVFIAEDGNDGFNKMSTYHDLTLEEYGDCKIFYSEKDAIDFVKTILK